MCDQTKSSEDPKKTEKNKAYIESCKGVFQGTQKALDQITYGASIVLVPLIMTVTQQESFPSEWKQYWVVSSILFVAVIIMSVWSNSVSQKACQMAIRGDENDFYASGEIFDKAERLDMFRNWGFVISLCILVSPIVVEIIK